MYFKNEHRRGRKDKNGRNCTPCDNYIFVKIYKKGLLNDIFRRINIKKVFIFGFLALFINASYIDAFEASKVAYTFWTIAGLYIGYYGLNYEKNCISQ